MASPPTDAVDLLRFLALTLEVHADALCCAVDDVESAIIESTTCDEKLECLEEELADLLERQQYLYAGNSLIAKAQAGRQRGQELLRSRMARPHNYGEKRIQATRGGSSVSGSVPLSRHPGASITVSSRASVTAGGAEGTMDERSSRSLSATTAATAFSESGWTESEMDNVDRQVELLKVKIDLLDSLSVRGKLRQLERTKRLAKEVDLQALVEKIVDPFEFPASVEALWSRGGVGSTSAAATLTVTPSTSTADSVSARDKVHTGTAEPTLAQCAVGEGGLVNHTNIDLLLARACQRLAGRTVDALESLASADITEESPAAHVLGCAVYATEFEHKERAELQSVLALQTMPPHSLANLYHRWTQTSICTAPVASRCLGGRDTVLSGQNFCALPLDWLATQALGQVPLDETLPPVRHLLTPRFTYADVGELKNLQSARVDLQEKIVDFLVSGQETEEELVRAMPGSAKDRAVAAARLAVADTTAATRSGHTWKTVTSVPNTA